MHNTRHSSLSCSSAGAKRAFSSRAPRPTIVSGIVLLALVIMLSGCGYQASSRSAGPAAPTATAVPLFTSGSYSVNMMIRDGVAYAAAGSEGVYALRASDGHLLWQRQLTGTIYYSTPQISNGIIYITSNVSDALSYTYALRASDGAQIWRYSSDSYAYPPAISGGVAYVAEQSGHVAALRASDGRLLWRAPVAVTVFGPPLVVNGAVYIGSGYDFYNGNNEPGYIYALRASDGHTLWRVTTGSSPTIPMAMNGVIYASTNNALLALRASDGHTLWRQSLVTSIGPQPQVANGVMYFITTEISYAGTPIAGSANSTLSPISAAGDVLQSLMEHAGARTDRPLKEGVSTIYAVRMDDGAILWHYKLSPEGGSNWANWLSISDSAVYFGSFVGPSKGYIYALRASDGVLLWRHTMQNATPDNGGAAGGVLYAAASTGSGLTTLYALRASDGSQIWQKQLDGPLSDAPILLGNILYVDTGTGAIYALRASDGAQLWHYITIDG